MHEQGLGMKIDWHLANRLYDLAAETNADAKVPVAIALLKLQVLAKIEGIKESPYKFVFYMDENIAANWDLCMITLLTLLLGFIMYTRTPYQNQQNAAPADAGDMPDNQPRQEEEEGNVAGNSGSASPSTIANDLGAAASKSDNVQEMGSSTTDHNEDHTSSNIDNKPTSSTGLSSKPSTSTSASSAAISAAKPPSALASTADPTD